MNIPTEHHEHEKVIQWCDLYKDDVLFLFFVKSPCNPVPYKRTTQKQKFRDADYHRYIEWKNYIVSEFAKNTGKLPHMALEKNKKYYVDVLAAYCNKAHGDTDNVAKGVNDALFQKPLSDKYVAGSYDYFYSDCPGVFIKIR